MFFFIYSEVSNDSKVVRKLDKNWVYMNETGEKTNVSLPEKIKTSDGEVILYKKIPENYKGIQFLFIYTNEQDIVVSIENNIIYKSDFENSKNILKKVKGKRWNEIELPDNSEGKTITIKISSDFQRKNERVSDIYVRMKDTTSLYILKEKLAPILGALIIFVVGIILVLVEKIFRNSLEGIKGPRYIGWFAIFNAIWVLTEIRIMGFVIDDPIFISLLGSIALMISPIPMLQYINAIKGYAYKQLVNVLIIIFYSNLFITIFLQVFNMTNFYNIKVITYALIPTYESIVLISLVVDLLKNKNKNVYVEMIALSFMYVFTSIEMIIMYLVDSYLNGKFLNIGIIIFITILSIKLVELLKLSKKSSYYKEAARKDFMTGFENRNAYIKDLERLKDEKDVSILVVDINGLKLINDNYGHSVGDETIINLCKIIKDTFYKEENCYRTGGDEFICIIKKWDKLKMEKAIKLFHKLCLEENNKHEYKFEVSVGSATYDSTLDNTIYDTIDRADFEMYLKKKGRKAIAK